MKLQSLKNLKNIAGKRVLVRCDFDVPVEKSKVKSQKSKILDDSRLKACLLTIEFLFKKKARIILIGHLGRPKGVGFEREFSLEPVRGYLDKVIKKLRITNYELRITLVPIEKYIGFSVKEAVQKMAPGQIVMLENLRFSDREQKNCQRFAKNLAGLADIYVNEAFAVSHRSASSVDAIKKYLPSYAGLHLQEEIDKLSAVLKRPIHPMTLIIGGAKIETKLPVIKQFIDKADFILVGGAVANTFLKADGVEVGKSMVDDEYINAAKNILYKFQIPNHKSKINSKSKITNSNLFLPVDVNLSSGENCQLSGVRCQVSKQESILDVGPKTMKFYAEIIKKSRMVVWNGPMGKFEDKKFRQGTLEIFKAIERSKASAVIGGGDTNEILKNIKLPKNVFVSVGGGAMLEFLAGKKLPGV